MSTWDEAKRLRNVKTHGVDFIGCEAVFDGPVVTWEDASEAYGEHRINLLGWLDGVVVHMRPTQSEAMNRTSSAFARQRSMKSVVTRKKLPSTPAEWEAAIAAPPGKDRPLTASEEARLAGAVVVRGGGYAAVRSALAESRQRGQRGPQQAPVKQLVSVRYSPEVLQYFKATGAGWQTRMNEALLEWVHEKSIR